MVDYVLKLFSLGFLCVPVTPGGRHLDIETIGYSPLHLQTRQKYLKELCFDSILFQLSQHPPSTETLQHWFSKIGVNIGVVGGYMNLIILDFDKPTVYQCWKKKNPHLVAATPVAKSPHGFHVYLRTAGPTISSSLHFGFSRAGHVKALGGYVLCTPSTLKEGLSYHWLPGQSPLEVIPQTVENLASIGLMPSSPLKVGFDRLMRRGKFVPN